MKVPSPDGSRYPLRRMSKDKGEQRERAPKEN